MAVGLQERLGGRHLHGTEIFPAVAVDVFLNEYPYPPPGHISRAGCGLSMFSGLISIALSSAVLEILIFSTIIYIIPFVIIIAE